MNFIKNKVPMELWSYYFEQTAKYDGFITPFM